jgi:hypothetical protein
VPVVLAEQHLVHDDVDAAAGHTGHHGPVGGQRPGADRSDPALDRAVDPLEDHAVLAVGADVGADGDPIGRELDEQVVHADHDPGLPGRGEAGL